MSPNEQVAVDLIKLVAARSDVFPATEALFLDRPDWAFIDERKAMLSGGERTIVELARDSWTCGTGSLASVMARCDQQLGQQVLDVLIEQYGRTAC